jgi:flagellar hook-associated protein FlgK
MDGHDGEPDSAAQRQALRKRAEQLGSTAEQLAAALDQLALHTELVLHRLRGSPTH